MVKAGQIVLSANSAQPWLNQAIFCLFRPLSGSPRTIQNRLTYLSGAIMFRYLLSLQEVRYQTVVECFREPSMFEGVLLAGCH